MTARKKDIKKLWGRSAGMCSNPDCRGKLIDFDKHADQTDNIHEMAHIMAKSPKGPRGCPEGGSNDYSNFILLCPTCHKKVDNSPRKFPRELLLKWKKEHEDWVRKKLSRENTVGSKNDLMLEIGGLLQENKTLFDALGPQSKIATSNPISNAYTTWDLRKMDTIIPNNSRIISYIESNKEYLTTEELKAFYIFKSHATMFHENQLSNDKMEDSPRFPHEFGKLFSL